MMILNYLFLLCAIILEVTGTLLLPISENFTKLFEAAKIVLYVAALVSLLLCSAKTKTLILLLPHVLIFVQVLQHQKL